MIALAVASPASTRLRAVATVVAALAAACTASNGANFRIASGVLRLAE